MPAVTLTAAQYGHFSLTLTGALTVNSVITFPSVGAWVINNQTTGAYSVTCQTVSGTGIAVAQGRANLLWASSTGMSAGVTDFTNITSSVGISGVAAVTGGAGNAYCLTLTNTGNVGGGAGILMNGPGATTPNKCMRVVAGVWQMINSANTAAIMTVDDAGDLTCAGNVGSSSDRRLKTDLDQIDRALDKVEMLTGYTYTFIDSGRRATGLIAQDVREVLPEVVGEDDKGMLSVAYGSMAGLFVEAIKEMTGEVRALRKRVEQLEDALEVA